MYAHLPISKCTNLLNRMCRRYLHLEQQLLVSTTERKFTLSQEEVVVSKADKKIPRGGELNSILNEKELKRSKKDLFSSI